MSDIKDNTASFRDRISTVDEKGKRKWIYPKKPKGKWYNRRLVVAYILLIILVALPFIKYDGKPVFLLDIIDRKFIILGQVFTSQDTYLFAIGTILLILFIVFFTFVFGRLFCGWICPQTIFMEVVYRRIEYAIEGDANAQIRLNKGPWTNKKIFKKVLKHAVFLILAFVFISLLLSLFTGIDRIFNSFAAPFENTGLALTILIVSLMFYYIFAFFREQVCTNVCPYGRMQGVLLVDNSIVVHYDFVRGERRAPVKERNNLIRLGEAKEEDFGDCIDCYNCVEVCPTGIDIRNGTQLECVNCTACMDACDEVMEKIKRPTGLIRYASEVSIRDKKPFSLTKRGYAYIAVLIVITGVFAFMAAGRNPVDAIILKTPGMTYQYAPGDSSRIINLYNFKLVNKTTGDLQDLEIKLAGFENAEIVSIPQSVQLLEEFGLASGSLLVTLPVSELQGYKTSVYFQVYAQGNLVDEVKSTFLAPR